MRLYATLHDFLKKWRLRSNDVCVGDVIRRPPSGRHAETCLWRYRYLPDEEVSLATQRILYEHPAIEYVEDALGNVFEALPHELLLLTHETALNTNALVDALERYFRHLAFRRLNFEVQRIPCPGAPPSLIFGDLLKPAPDRCERARLHVLDAGTARLIPVMFNGQPHDGLAFNPVQQAVFLALGNACRLQGVPFAHVERQQPDHVLVLRPGTEGPQVQLRILDEPGQPGEVRPLFRPDVRDLGAMHFHHCGGYSLRLEAFGLEICLLPETGGLRFLQRRPASASALKVLGVLLPHPGAAVRGMAVRFAENGQLLAHGMIREFARLVLDAEGNAYVRYARGRAAQEVDSNGHVPGQPLIFSAPGEGRTLQAAVQHNLPTAAVVHCLLPDVHDSFLALHVYDRSHLGFIALDTAWLADKTAFGRRCHIRYDCPTAADEDAAPQDHISLSWLNHAVQLALAERDDIQISGLAQWWREHVGGESFFHVQEGQLLYETTVNGRHCRQRLDDRTVFAMGPLIVQLLLGR